MPRPAIFLDRDGVINVGVKGDYIRNVSQLRWLPGVPQAVAALSNAGWPIVVITNQSGIARGLYTMTDVSEIHQRIRSVIQQAGGDITAFYVCPHRDEDRCACRKPLPGMLSQAARDYDLDLAHSFFIGDTEIDARAGRAAGCAVITVATGLTPAEEVKRWPSPPDHIFNSLMEAAEWINRCGSDPS
ncbi:MAG TPA: D-glycero-beta-D-manno-heptose 1,7-bisphosphate 7-phosphatase [Armatimonadota bacterium]|jgi:D-glycero-D-manno-heptose 1,7-bisphosphate phosphatase